MAENTWTTYELPILEAVREIEDGAGFTGSSDQTAELAVQLGIDDRKTRRTVAALVDAGYLSAIEAGYEDGERCLILTGLGERGRRAVGQWPSEDAFADFVQLLDQRIGATADEQERSKLEQFRDGLLGVSRGVATSLFTAWAQQRLGL